MTISVFVADIIDKCILEVKKDNNITKIEKQLIDPLIQYTFKKLYPYLALASIIFFLIFLLAILILLLQVKQLKNLSRF
mgnify:CR=1 FL=1|tara:strand:+ start:2480 stop:2716 length:237 start_codon:yes stop_codon:yes gene_type:complete